MSKEYTGTISSKGRVTIPVEIRKRMGLRAGDRVEFITESGVTTIRPSRGDVNPFEAYAGALGTFEGGVAEINQWVGDLRGREKP